MSDGMKDEKSYLQSALLGAALRLNEGESLNLVRPSAEGRCPRCDSQLFKVGIRVPQYGKYRKLVCERCDYERKT